MRSKRRKLYAIKRKNNFCKLLPALDRNSSTSTKSVQQKTSEASNVTFSIDLSRRRKSEYFPFEFSKNLNKNHRNITEKKTFFRIEIVKKYH